MILLLDMNDIVVTCNTSQLLTSFILALGYEFKIKEFDDHDFVLGIEVSMLSHGLHLSQTKYTLYILRHSSMLKCRPYTTLLSATTQFSTNSITALIDTIEYHHLVGCLPYLTFIRLNIAYDVHHVAQFISSPISNNMLAIKCILLYLRGSMKLGLVFYPSKGILSLPSHFDAGWVGFPNTSHSMIGYCAFLGQKLISWTAKKQQTVSHSSAESKYRSLSHVCAKTALIPHLLYDLSLPLPRPITLHYDNLSTTYMTSDPVFHARTKHIKLDYHFVQERVISCSLRCSICTLY